MITIELNKAQANTLLTALDGLTDQLNARLKEEYSGLTQFLIESTLIDVKNIADSIDEQIKAQTPAPEAPYVFTAEA